MRRILLISAAVIVLVGAGVGIYFLFFANKPTLSVNQTQTTLPGSADATQQTNTQTPTTQGIGVPTAGAGTLVAPRLIRITDKQVALGSIAVFVPGVPAPKVGTTTVASSTTAYATDPDVRVEYIERESGNIYDFQSHARTLTRLTNKTLPGVVEASWIPDGSLAYTRFTVKTDGDTHTATYALPANGADGYFLDQDLSQVLVTGSSTLLTVLPSSSGSTATLSTPSGTNVHSLFTSTLAAIKVFIGGNTYTVTTKASSKSNGYAFLVDPKSGSFTRALGPLTGLTTLVSPSGKYILYSFLDKGKLSLAVFDVTAHTATRLPLATLTEKCTWASDSSAIFCGVPTAITGNIPDDWYQGVASFSDRLWKIDLNGRVATQIIDPKQVGSTDVDAVSLTVDRTNDVLLFTNKRDGTLWQYDL